MALNIKAFTIGSNGDISHNFLDNKWNINITPGSRSCQFSFLKNLPQNFLITTNNSSGKFNTLLLENISPVIKSVLFTNPDSTEYHLDIEDPNNALGKLEQIYQGEPVTITEDIQPIFNEIIQNLEISQPLNFEFLKLDVYERFIIETNKKRYICNIFGILSSSVLRDILSDNEEERYFFYDIEDSNEEFEIIRDIFNFKEVKITNDNYGALRKFIDDLKIECLFNILEKFNRKDEYRETIIDEQEAIIDRINELFDPLFNIKEKTIESTFAKIVESKLSKSDKYACELASFLVTISQIKIELQDLLIELMIKLNNDGPENMKKLKDFVISKSLFLFSKKMDSTEPHLIYPFVYKMYKKKLIQRNQIDLHVNHINFKNYYFISWFIAEIFEEEKFNFIEDKISFNYGTIEKKDLFFTKDINCLSEYNEMRDKNENDDGIAKAIRNDDINQLQTIVSNNPDQILKGKVKKNIFEPFIKSGTSYLNYAAVYGSVKCFKYLLLNKVEVDQLTYELSLIGGNFEIVRIIDNEKNFDYSNDAFVLNLLKKTIKYHQNDLFDWILDLKYQNINQAKHLESLIDYSIEFFNCHSLTQIIGNIDLILFGSTIKFSSFFESAIEKGSCNYFNLLMNYFDLENADKISISLMSILKLFKKSKREESFIEAMILTLKNACENVINQISVNDGIIFDEEASKDILICFGSLFFDKKDNCLFDKIVNICSYNSDVLQNVISGTVDCDNNEFYKKIIDLVSVEKSDVFYNQILITFISKNKYEMTKYIIDKKYPVDFDNLVNEIQKCGSMSVELFQLVNNQLNSKNKLKFVNLMDSAIVSYNKHLVEYMIDEDLISENALIEAVEKRNHKLIEKILEKRNDSSFINGLTDRGNALYSAVAETDVFAIKKLLSIPGIDPSLVVYVDPYRTSLILSGLNNTFDIFLDFYGEKIKEQKWELEEIVRNIMDNDEESIQLHSDHSYDKNYYLERFKQIIKLNCIDLNIYSKHETVLTFAIKRNENDLVRELLQNDLVDVNLATPDNDKTPLIKAFENENKIAANLLINHPKLDWNQCDYFSFAPDEMKVYFFIKNDRSKIYQNMIDVSKLDYLKKGIFSQLSKYNITEIKMLREKTYNKEYIDQFENTFDLAFPNFSSRNFDSPLESQEFITCLFCEIFSIDFISNLFTVDITKNYYHIENKASFHIKILNRNPKLSKIINLQIKYLNKISESTSLPLKLDDILNPENGWLFNDTLKLQIIVFSAFKRINSFEKIKMSPLLPQKLTDDVFGYRFLIPIYLFDQNKFENLIKFPQLSINNESHSIYPVIFYYNEDGKIYIHTYFFFTFGFDNLIVYYENKDHNKNLTSMFFDVKGDYVQMPVLTLEKAMEKEGFTFISGNQRMLQLCLKIQ